jgi:putative transcriptional regulator
MNVFARRAALVRELAEVEAQEETILRNGLATVIVRLRTGLGQTQEQLAEKCGILRTTLANIENEKQNTTLEVLCRIASALDLAPWELLKLVMEASA